MRQPFKRKTILSWLVDCKIIRVGDLVQYRTNLDGTNKTYELVTGRICNGAIICSCCGDEFSIWNFEKHLGSNRGQPYDHITTPKTSRSSSTCLIDCMMLSWDNLEEQNRRSIFTYVPRYDAVCLVCGGEGEYLYCHDCPSVYHHSCVNMQVINFVFVFALFTV